MSPRDRRYSVRHGDRRHAWTGGDPGRGGIAFAQDESARYDSMQRGATAAGCVSFVLSPENIAKERARIAKCPTSRVAS